MALPVTTVPLSVIGLNDKKGHVAAPISCDWTINSQVNVNINGVSFQDGTELQSPINSVLVDNTANKGDVTINILGLLSVTVSAFQRQSISLPDKVNAVSISGTVGTCQLIFTNGDPIAPDALNYYLATIGAGTAALFAVNKYTLDQTIASGDFNKTIVLSAAVTKTLTFPQIAGGTPIANGIIFLVENIGTAAWNLQPNAVDNFNEGTAGAAIVLNPGESLFVVSNGTSTFYGRYIQQFTDVQLLGNSKAVTPSPGDNDTSIATTAFVAAAIAANPSVTSNAIVKASDENRSSTTLTDDGSFSFAMLANTTYIIDVVYELVHGGSSNAPKVGITGPASPSSVATSFIHSPDSITVPSVSAVSSSASASFSGANVASVSGTLRIRTIWTNGVNAGTFKIQTASSNITTMSYKANSIMTYLTTN